MEAESTTPWAELTKELVDLMRRFGDVLDGDEDLQGLLRRAALLSYAHHQAVDPDMQARIAAAEADLELWRREGPPDGAFSAEELAARVRALAEERRQHRAAG